MKNKIGSKNIGISLIIILFCILFESAELSAQNSFGGIAEFDKTTYDFGDILSSDGPVSCTFNVKNISDKEMVIYSVITSCGCTNVKWTRETIAPGKVAEINATYTNEDGPYPFDKTLTAYISNVKQPVILHIRGIVREKKQSIAESFPVKFGSLALRSAEIIGGNLDQGQQKSGEVTVGNLLDSPTKVEFKDVSENLEISIVPNPIPAGGTAKLIYTINANRTLWGRNWYYATPVVNGRVFQANGTPNKEKVARGAEALVSDPNPNIGPGHSVIGISAITREDFSGLTKEEKESCAAVTFKSSSFTFGKTKAGEKIEAEWEYTNSGKSELIFYKADSGSNKVKIMPAGKVASGKAGKLKATLDTSGLPRGEVLILVTVITNAPARPLINLYITGFIQ